MVSGRRLHFSNVKVTAASRNSVKTCLTFLISASRLVNIINSSFKYTRTNCQWILDKMTSIAYWNVLGAFFNSTGIRMNWNNLWYDVNTGFPPSLFAILTFQRLLTFRVETLVPSPKTFMNSSIRKMRYKLRTVAVLSLLMSTQNQGVQSFSGSRTIC